MSDTSTIDVDAAEGTRVPIRDRAPRETPADKNETPVVAVTEGDATQAEPIDASVAEITRTLQDTQTRAAQDAERARIAEQGRQRAEGENVRLRHVAQTSQHALAAAAVETATSELSRATQALRAAREAGDGDAETKALIDIGAASAREANAKQQLAAFAEGGAASEAGRMTEPGAAPGQRPQQQQPQDTGLDPRAQAWIDAHPRFNTDPAYRAAMLAEHDRVTRHLKVPANTDQYFDHLDSASARLNGAAAPGESDMTTRQNGNGQQRPQSFQGARPTSGERANGSTVVMKTALSELTVLKNPDGSVRQIKVPPSAVSDYKEWAETNGMKYDEYVRSLVEIELAGETPKVSNNAEQVFR